MEEQRINTEVECSWISSLNASQFHPIRKLIGSSLKAWTITALE